MAVWMPGRTAVLAESTRPAENTGPAGDPVPVRAGQRDEVLVDG